MNRTAAHPFARFSAFLASAATAVMVSATILSACATTHGETRDECGARCSRKYEECARNAIVPDSLHACGVEGDRCAAMCPLH